MLNTKTAKKAQGASIAKPYIIRESVTTTGKPSLVLDLKTSGMRLAKEDFATLRMQVGLAGGFGYMSKGMPCYIGIDAKTLASLLDAFTFIKPEPKVKKQEAKKQALADISADAVTPEMIAILRKLLGK